MTLVIAQLLLPLLASFVLGLGVGWFWWRWRQPKIVATETRTFERLDLGDDPTLLARRQAVADAELTSRIHELETELAGVDHSVVELERLIDDARQARPLDR
ncbi:MAG: hypothetical protein R2710_01550 [Acidimicrobiales bacterium]